MKEGWNDKVGKWSPAASAVEKRAKEARLWLRALGEQGEGDREIVVVTHGGYLHYFTEDWDGYEKFSGSFISQSACELHLYLPHPLFCFGFVLRGVVQRESTSTHLILEYFLPMWSVLISFNNSRVMILPPGVFFCANKRYDIIGTGWANTEFRSYVFTDASGQDQNASLVETMESRERRRSSGQPLTADEEKELKATAENGWSEDGFLTTSESPVDAKL